MAITAFNLGGGKLKLSDAYQVNHDSNGSYLIKRDVTLYIANKAKLLFIVYTTDSVHTNTKLSINCTSGEKIVDTTWLSGNRCTYACYRNVAAGSTINFGTLEAGDHNRFRAYAFN